MKKLLALLLALTLVFCSASVLAEEDSLAGNWIYLINRNTGSLILNDDGTAVMDGQEGLTWTEEGLDLGGFVIPFGLEGDKLVLFSFDGKPAGEAYREDSDYCMYTSLETVETDCTDYVGTYSIVFSITEDDTPVVSLSEGDEITIGLIFDQQPVVTLPGLDSIEIYTHGRSGEIIIEWINQGDGSFLLEGEDDLGEGAEEVRCIIAALENGYLGIKVFYVVEDEEVGGMIAVENSFYAERIDN